MQRTKVTYYLLLVIMMMTLSACGKKDQPDLKKVDLKQADESEKETEEKPAEPPESKGQNIVVYVCGEVNRSGVYELPQGSRLYQALEAAGGLTAAAAGTYLNQAELLSDGQSVYVPTQTEAEGMVLAQAPGEADSSGQTKVNLNTAAKEQLMTLTGIGEAKADSIIEYRETNGNFQSIDEIKNIPGIKDGVFQKIKDQIIV